MTQSPDSCRTQYVYGIYNDMVCTLLNVKKVKKCFRVQNHRSHKNEITFEQMDLQKTSKSLQNRLDKCYTLKTENLYVDIKEFAEMDKNV